jgi:threonyl-tRNA synthetase
MYRSELSGVLGGLIRVRAIQLNDAHIFCTSDQLASEVLAALELIRRAYDALGIEPARYRLSLPGGGGKYVADQEMWQRAEGVLRAVLDESGVAYDAVEGEAAFYGPKIDVQVTDSAGREATLSTVQVDFHQPAQFDLRYIGPDGAKHRPVMVHRSIIGSMERAVAQLIEVHGGAFPAWLAPTAVVLLPISDAQLPAALRLLRQAIDRGLRARICGPEEGGLGARIRAHRLVPYQAVIGADEMAADEIALRLRDGRRLPALPAAQALARIGGMIDRHCTDLWDFNPAFGGRAGAPSAARAESPALPLRR